MASPICLRKLQFFTTESCKRYSINHRFYRTSSQARVVITGLGLVTCLGVGVNTVWSRLLEGHCGITSLDDPEYNALPCRVAGLIPKGDKPGELNLSNYFTPSELRNLPLSAAYSLIAADEAIADSGWISQCERDSQSAGVSVGMGMVDLEYVAQVGATLRDKGIKKISPHFIPNILLNMPAGSIGIKHQLKGPNHTVSTACSTGLVAIGDAFNMIRCGTVSMMVAGGTEACINPLSLAGFSRLRALSTAFNGEPVQASRPFDKRRDGFVMSEGAGVMVLEDLHHATQRGVTKIYGEVLGYGIVGDAHHATAPSSDGSGAVRSMSAAMSDGDVDRTSVGYINAHATSTPLGDAVECRAIKDLFGDQAGKLLVSSTKGAVGHSQGAAGAMEAVFTVLATHVGVVPPTINLEESDDENDLNCVANTRQLWPGGERRVGLTNSFGFWGTNATLCVGQF